MTYLVDANVLSEATKPDSNPKVVEWLRQNEPAITADPIILGELKFGILLLPRGKRRARLEHWFEEGIQQIHCVAWDAETGLRWARLLADLRATGRSMSVKDSLIAATALHNDLAVVTRNQRDFENAGVEMVDPFV